MHPFTARRDNSFTAATREPEKTFSARRISTKFPPPPVITSKAANGSAAQDLIVLPCCLLWRQVGSSAPAPQAAPEHMPVICPRARGSYLDLDLPIIC